MDMQDAPGGIWRTRADGRREFDPEQIDRLDFFLNELHNNGIYANLNLHVSRTLTEAEGFPEYQSGLWWTDSNKWVTYYDPDVQRELKTYCRQLLTHVNPYRNLRRSDDPGVAMVEMLNENYFSIKGTELVRRLPKRFQNSFRAKWNQWLSDKYGSEARMRSDWIKQQQPMGEVLVGPAKWNEDLGSWAFSESNVSARKKFGTAGPKADVSAVRFEPTGRSDADHHLQLRHSNLKLVSGQPYTLKAWVRADKERMVGLELSTNQGGEWRDLGLFESVGVDQEWKELRRTVIARESLDGEVNLSFNFGLDATPVEFAGVSLQEGVEMIALDKRQNFKDASVGVPETGWPSASHHDMQDFLVDTERSWILELKSFLKNELGVKVPITASQENYHAPGIVAETCDFVDFHNYWHHPLFPGDAAWSKEQWTVEQQAIESAPTRSNWPANSLLMRTGWRYHNMPFTLSEWNQGEPNATGSGAVMMGAVIGSLQDWDGIMFFNYTDNGDRWFSDHFEGWFDFAGHPVKQAVLAAAGNLYLRGDLPSLKNRFSGTLTDRLDGRAAFQAQIGIDVNATHAESVSVPETDRFETPDGSVLWDASDPDSAFIRLNTEKTIGVWGLVANQNFEIGNTKFQVRDVTHQYATLLLTSKDNQPLKTSKSMLLLASSGAENTNMKWNEARNSVGDQWGTGPTKIHPVNAVIRLPRAEISGTPTVYALDGTGRRTEKVDVATEPADFVIVIGGRYQTLWYEIDVQ